MVIDVGPVQACHGNNSSIFFEFDIVIIFKIMVIKYWNLGPETIRLKQVVIDIWNLLERAARKWSKARYDRVNGCLSVYQYVD